MGFLPGNGANLSIPCSRDNLSAQIPSRARPELSSFAPLRYRGERKSEREKEGEMETVTVAEAVKDPTAVAPAPGKRNRIQVSTNKKPLYFYVNLAKVSPPLEVRVSFSFLAVVSWI